MRILSWNVHRATAGSAAWDYLLVLPDVALLQEAGSASAPSTPGSRSMTKDLDDRAAAASRKWSLYVLCGISLIGVTVRAQTAGIPPMRQLPGRAAIAQDTLASVAEVRALTGNRVLVNDAAARRLLLFDSTLTHVTVVADSTLVTRRAYGSEGGGLLGYRDDSSLFVDPVALSMLVVDPGGSLTRTLAPPRPDDAGDLSLPAAKAAFDGVEHLVYRDAHARCTQGRGCQATLARPAPPSGDPQSVVPPYARRDSAAILRADMKTSTVDTVGFIGVPFQIPAKFVANADGSTSIVRFLAVPLPIQDDWAVMSDGTVAIVRGLDYHIDWVALDGSRTSTPRIPHEWRRLSDMDKEAVVDSMRRVADSVSALQAHVDSMARASGRAPASAGKIVVEFPEASELPDYLPFLVSGAVSADAEDHLWIRQNGGARLSGPAPPAVYDVVDRRGLLIDRVQLPASLALAGFGPGVIYLTSREGTGVVLLRFRIR